MAPQREAGRPFEGVHVPGGFRVGLGWIGLGRGRVGSRVASGLVGVVLGSVGCWAARTRLLVVFSVRFMFRRCCEEHILSSMFAVVRSTCLFEGRLRHSTTVGTACLAPNASRKTPNGKDRKKMHDARIGFPPHRGYSALPTAPPNFPARCIRPAAALAPRLQTSLLLSLAC